MSNLTKKAITASFFKLLNARPLNKITVKDIVEDCGINRNSFYYHFQGIPSLIEAIISEETEKIVGQYPTVDSLEEGMKIAVESILQNKKAVSHIYHSVNRDIFEGYLWRLCEYIVRTYLTPLFGKYKLSESDEQIFIRYYKCQMFGQIAEWLEDGMREDWLTSGLRLFEIRRGLLEESLKRCEKK